MTTSAPSATGVAPRAGSTSSCARARVRVEGGRLTWTSAPPVVLRRTGPRRVHLVQVGGGPLGGDDLGLEVELGAGEHLTVRTAAATVVQPGPDPTAGARLTVTARLAVGAVLDWHPEPTVICDGADWTASLAVDLADGARATLREQVVLGRSGQQGGRGRSTLRVDVAGVPLLATSTHLDGADPALAGPGGTGGARSVGSLVVAGRGAGPTSAGSADDVTWAWTELDGPGVLLTALGTSRAVTDVLDGEGSAAAT